MSGRRMKPRRRDAPADRATQDAGEENLALPLATGWRRLRRPLDEADDEAGPDDVHEPDGPGPGASPG